jgi:hypothetical protein
MDAPVADMQDILVHSSDKMARHWALRAFRDFGFGRLGLRS